MRKISDYLSTYEAAEILGVSPSLVRLWDGKGILPAYKSPHSKHRLYLREDLDQFLGKISNVNVCPKE